MPKIPAPVLWDNNNNFLHGITKGIDAESTVVGYATKPAGIAIPGFPATTTQCLEVKDLQNNAWYLSITLDQWRSLLSQAQQSNNKDKTLTFTIGSSAGQKPAGSTLSDPQLYSVTLVSVAINGSAQDLRAITYVSAGTITFPAPLTNGEIVEIICYNN